MKPLAAKMRPEKLDEFVGQKHLVGEGKPLRLMIELAQPSSFILWGPPGVGKTTLARIYIEAIDAKSYELSAVSAGKKDVKGFIEEDSGGKPKLLFLDEIHRFNKAQQDFLLPFVESGELFLVGSTTENPSLEVIPPLLSRCTIFILNPLSDEEIREIAMRTEIEIEKEALDWLVELSGGDARRTLGLIEEVNRLYRRVTVDSLKESMKAGFIGYGKKGEGYYRVISAFIKSMRASQVDAALYYLARMLESGEEPKVIARRMVVFASEDIGMAQPTALVVANEVFRAVETVGLPEAAINLAHGAVYLSLCKKDRRAYDGLVRATDDVKRHGELPIPAKIINPLGAAGKKAGHGEGYQAYSKESFLPDKLKKKRYYL